MNASMLLWDRMRKNRLVVQITPPHIDECLRIYEALHPMGVTLEIALNRPDALAGIREIRQKHPDALILAGMILTHQEAERAIEAGVSGICSPDYIPIVVEVCARRDVMCIPGGLLDAGKQLVQKAAYYNCELDELRTHHPYQWVYRISPAWGGNMAFFETASSLLKTYKGLTLLYSGGVTPDRIEDILARDPTGILCGCPDAGDKNPDKLKQMAEEWLSQVHRKEHPIDKSFKRETVTETQVKDSPPPVETPDKAGEKYVVTFGEIMLHLRPPQGSPIGLGGPLDAVFSGAESNVALSLSRYGLRTRHITQLPEHSLGEAAIETLRAFDVDTAFIPRGGERVGICFAPAGTAGSSPDTLFDRSGASFSSLEPGTIDWNKVFHDAQWFHFSGITPALGDRASETTLEALKAAKRAHLTVSCDLSFQEKFLPVRKARKILNNLLPFVDIVVGTERDLYELFSLQPDHDAPSQEDKRTESLRVMSREMFRLFGLKTVAVLVQEDRPEKPSLCSAFLFNGKESLLSSKFTLPLVVDRIDGRGAFVSSLIHGLLSGKGEEEAIELAAAAAALREVPPDGPGDASFETDEITAACEEPGKVVLF